ncbi:MAG TPA: pilus assembly protein PilB, partial [Rugosimonospora sp.]|nr:pilus assembly protein PilB [Rugosimonospora sp.]
MKISGRARPAEESVAGPAAEIPVIIPTAPRDTSIHPGGRRLGELLVDASVVPESAMVAVLAEAQQLVPPRLLGELLVERGHLSERQLAKVIAWQHGLDVVDLREVTPSAEATRLLDEHTARRVVAIPLSVQNGKVVVAAAYPTDAARQILRMSLDQPVVVQVAAQSDILRAIGNSYRALTGVTGAVKVFESQHLARREPVIKVDISPGSDDAPVVQVVQMMITQGLRDRASDIHI